MDVEHRIKVSIVESNTLYLEGYLQLLSNDQQVQVIDHGVSAKTVFDRMNGSPPDVIIANTISEDWDITEFCSRIRDRYPRTRLVANGSFHPGPLIKLLIRHGVAGYFLKEKISQVELIRMVKEAYEGGVSRSSVVTDEVIDDMERTRLESIGSALSEREREILQLVCQGMSRSEMAEELSITEATVKFHLDRLREKFNCSSVVKLVSLALRKGIV